MKRIFIFFSLSFLVATVLSAADQVQIRGWFITGEDFIGMKDSEKHLYTAGVIDGMLIAPIFDALKEEMKWFESYTYNMSTTQLASILSKYLKENPEKWHIGSNILMFLAIKQAYDKNYPEAEKRSPDQK